jgi:DNA-binding NarL/FixJ family response regulator
VRVLIVDDLTAARLVVHRYLAAADGVEVVGVAESGEDAIRRVEELRPDVVVMDVQMPGMGGIEATKRIREFSPVTRVVGFGFCDDGVPASSLREAGASQFVAKGSPLIRLLKTIRENASTSPGANDADGEAARREPSQPAAQKRWN